MATTLLAVDDSKTMRRVLEITFAGEDYKVVLAENGAQALEKIRSARPAVALIDAGLGGESGYDLCQQIKREAPGVGVLILSSKQQPYDKARGTSAGADEFMDKPFDTQQLIDKTAALVRRMAEAPPPQGRQAAAPAPSPRAPGVSPGIQPRAAAPQMSPQPPTRAHVQTLVGSAPGPAPQAAPAPPATVKHAPAPPPAPVAPPTPAAAPVAAAMASAGNGQFAERLAGLGLSRDQVEGVLALSREIVEQVVWEVVPQLAETLIREEIRRLTND